MKGQQIKTIRKRLGLSQKKLAERLGVKRLAVARWESGIRKPDSKNQKRLLHLAMENGLDTKNENVSSKQKNVSSKVDTKSEIVSSGNENVSNELDTKSKNVSNEVDTKSDGGYKSNHELDTKSIELDTKKETGYKVDTKLDTNLDTNSQVDTKNVSSNQENVSSGNVASKNVSSENVANPKTDNPSIDNQEVSNNNDGDIKKDDVKATFAMLAHEAPVELRIFPSKGYPVVETASTEDEFITICERWNGKAQIYCGVRERRAGFLLGKEKGKAGDANDIVAVTLTVVDIDPIRAEGFAKQATTDEELAYALKASEHLARWHEARAASASGFLRPPRAMSGNGVQLWFPIPRWEVTDLTREEIPERLAMFEEECRNALPSSLRDFVSIDSIHDLPRIIKVIGTQSVKGNPTPERPHRVSHWIDDERSPLAIGRQEDPKLLEHLPNMQQLQPELQARAGSSEASQRNAQRQQAAPITAQTQQTTDSSPLRGSPRTAHGPASDLDWQECEFLQYCRDNAQTLSEPLWYAMLSNLSRFGDEGRQLAHQLSKTYSGYSVAETDKKLNHAFTASGPMTCNEIVNRGFRCTSLRRCKANAPASLIGQLSGITIVCPEVEDYEIINMPKQKTIIPLEIEKVIPPDSYLSRYMEYASELTDAPAQFHVFSGLSAVSTAIGNRIYLPWGDGRLYPNLWIVMIAPSSIYRKTTAIRIACNIIRHVDETAILPDEFSPESLLSVLESRPQGLFFWGELRAKLAYFQRSYMAGMQAMLTELYDCPPVYTRLLKDSRHTVNNPCIGILAASTKEWLRASITEGEMKGGFLQRFMFVLAHSKKKHLSIPETADMTKQNELVMMLNRIRACECKIDLTDIRDAFDEWHFKHEQEAMNADNEEVLASFYARLDTYCLKLTMLYEIAMQMKSTDFPFGELRPRPEALSYAANLIEYSKATINYMLSEELVFSKEMASRQKVLGLIESKPGTSRSVLMRKSKLLKREFDLILETLHEEGTIAIQKKGKRGGLHYFPIRGKNA